MQAAEAPKIRETAAKAHPLDQFEDLQAYRSRLRSELSAAQLDDRHDDYGNTLYRLQFDATVLPRGSGTNRWGAAEVTIIPPEFDQYQMEQLFFSWIGYAASRLNIRNRTPLKSASGSANKATSGEELKSYAVRLDATFYSLLQATGMFEVIPVPCGLDHALLKSEDDSCLGAWTEGCGLIYLPVPKGMGKKAGQYVREILKKPWESNEIDPEDIDRILADNVGKALSIAIQGAAHGLKINEIKPTPGTAAFLYNFIYRLDRPFRSYKHQIGGKSGTCTDWSTYGPDCFKTPEYDCDDTVWSIPPLLFACLVQGKQPNRPKPQVTVFDVAPA